MEIAASVGIGFVAGFITALVMAVAATTRIVKE
jgi:hypothetical protein